MKFKSKNCWLGSAHCRYFIVGSTYFQITIVINENVFGFKISINYIEEVCVLKRQHYLSRIDTRMRLAELPWCKRKQNNCVTWYAFPNEDNKYTSIIKHTNEFSSNINSQQCKYFGCIGQQYKLATVQ